MNNIKQYTTIKDFAEFIYKEKSSEFIGQAYPVETQEEFQNILTDIKKRYYDASHNCYALKILENFVKYSDDGEPNGTAGIRILNAIEHFQLVNVMLVVTRYFGGTKLGVGPLGKAYYAAAEKTFEKCVIVTKKSFEKIFIQANFQFVSNIHHAIASAKAKIVNTEYNENVVFECLIEPALVENIVNQLRELSGGQIKVEKTGKYLFLQTIE